MGVVGIGEICRDTGFQVSPGGRVADRQEIQHEFGDGDAGGRHSGNEPFEVRKPFLSRNIIEGMGTEDEIALGLRTGG